MIGNIQSTYSNLDIGDSTEILEESILHPGEPGITQRRAIVVGSSIEILLTGWEASIFAYPKIAQGRRQLTIDFMSVEGMGNTYTLLLDNPKLSLELSKIYSHIASCLSAFAGIVGSNYTMYFSDEYSGMDYLEWVFKDSPTFSSLYLDQELAGSIGLSNLKRWGSIVDRVGDDGYFISKKEIPMITGGSSESWKDEYYIDYIAPKIIERIWYELSSIDTVD